MSGTDLSSVWFLAVAVGVAAVGLTGLWLVRRRPRSMQTSMDTFSRELQALAPSSERQDRESNRGEPVIDLREQPEPPMVQPVRRRQSASAPGRAESDGQTRRRRSKGQG